MMRRDDPAATTDSPSPVAGRTFDCKEAASFITGSNLDFRLFTGEERSHAKRALTTYEGNQQNSQFGKEEEEKGCSGDAVGVGVVAQTGAIKNAVRVKITKHPPKQNRLGWGTLIVINRAPRPLESS